MVTTSMMPVVLFLLVFMLGPRCAQAQSPLLQQLEQQQAKDPIISAATQWVRAIVPALLPQRTNNPVGIYVVDYPAEEPAKTDPLLRTDACKALTRRFPHPVIICNAQLLYEYEAVVRVFEGPNDFMSSDEALFRLVRALSSDPKRHLLQLRASSRDESTGDLMQHVTQHMKLMLLYFVSHELGHVFADVDNKQFVSAFSPDKPLEDRIVEAVIRTCRHADEFTRLGFGLPGFEEVTQQRSEARNVEQKFRQRVLVAAQNADEWYKKEVEADQWGTKLVLDYLARLDRSDATASKESQHLIVANLYFTSIYAWYKDLHNFSSSACSGQRLTNSASLTVCMAMDRKRYIEVASLFGEVHRHLLLRSHLAIEKILEVRTTFFKLKPAERTIWPDPDKLRRMKDKDAEEAIWYFGALQSYYFLAILMDTPVKFSNVACATGWLKEIDERRNTPQLLVMMFEPIDMVVQRLKRFR